MTAKDTRISFQTQLRLIVSADIAEFNFADAEGCLKLGSPSDVWRAGDPISKFRPDRKQSHDEMIFTLLAYSQDHSFDAHIELLLDRLENAGQRARDFLVKHGAEISAPFAFTTIELTRP